MSAAPFAPFMQMQAQKAKEEGGRSESQNLTEAMSLLTLTNKCFTTCVVKHKPVLINDENRG